jgi:CRP/FNR family transcriptional regulator
VHDIVSLARTRRLIRFDRRQVIRNEGAPSSLFNVISGVVKLYRSLSDGRTQIVGFRFPGEFFVITDSDGHSTTAEALTFVEVCKFSHSRLKRLTLQFSQTQAKLLDVSYRQLATAEEQILLLGRKTASEKVASFLLFYGQKFDPERTEWGLQLPMTRAEIADFLGLTTETVSRALTALAREKIIAVSLSHTIRFLNVDLLRRAAGS